VTSLRSTSVARLGATLSRSAVALITTTVTARALGPSDKGTLSALLFVVMLMSYVSSLGLGDAAVVLTRSGRADLRAASGATIAAVGLASAGGIAVLAVTAAVPGWWDLGSAMVFAVVLLPLATFSYVLTALHGARDRLLVTSLAITVSSVAECIAVVVFVSVLGLRISGGIAAAVIGMAVSIAVLLPPMVRAGAIGAVRLRRTYLRPALRFGLVNESAFVLVALAQRADVLLVYSIAGEGQAGRYSVALSVSQLAAYAAGAVGFSAFPRLASLHAVDAGAYIARLCRLSLLATLSSSAVLAVLVPLVVPTVFGAAFRGTVAPTLVLLLGAAPWTFLSLASRAAAAAGDPRARFVMYGTTVAAMLLLDVVAIPAFGLVGAALSYVATLLIGCGLGLRWLRTHHGVALADLLPRAADAIELAAVLRGGRRPATVSR
jgi:O-antigen/teichoic acid export membrane protein